MTCHHCGKPAITGEGARVCHVCLLRFASAAARPDLLADIEVTLLEEAHGDVLGLIPAGSVAMHTSSGAVVLLTRSVWGWDASWPRAGDYRLIGGSAQ